MNLNSKSHLRLLLVAAVILRVMFCFNLFSNNFNWDNGSNQGVLFTDGDFTHYKMKAELIHETWLNGFNFDHLWAWLPFGDNGLLYTHFLALINIILHEGTTFQSHACVAFIQIFVFHAVRVYIVHRLASNCFGSDRITNISTAAVAFDPIILRWDLVLMKESFLSTLCILGMFLFSKYQLSVSGRQKRAYFMVSLLVVYMIFLDRFYMGIFMLSGIFMLYGTQKYPNFTKAINIRTASYVVLFVAGIVWYTLDWTRGLMTNVLISEESSVQFGSPFGWMQIMLTPMPLHATVRFDVEYLSFYGFLTYYFFLFFFIKGALKIIRNRFHLTWLIAPICFLILILGLLIPGGARRRDNLLPLIYIVSAYGIVRSKRLVANRWHSPEGM